jgi:hypothetical protein
MDKEQETSDTTMHHGTGIKNKETTQRYTIIFPPIAIA